jgi:hypothetical protein
MENDNILISWNQCINDWLVYIKPYLIENNLNIINNTNNINELLLFTTLLSLQSDRLFKENLIDNKYEDIKNKTLYFYKKYNMNKFKEIVLNDNINNYEMKDVLPIQRINYLIYPFQTCKDVEHNKYLSISMSDQDVFYNINPLIYKNEAIKFGPIQPANTGINNSLINRFKTILLNKTSSLPNKDFEINTILDSLLPIFTGYTYKYIQPVFYKLNKKWLPMNGAHTTVYRYNELLSDKIFNKLKIKKYNDEKNIQNLSINDIKRELKEEDMNVSSLCFQEIKRIKTDNTDINKEIYLTQFFNTKKIISSISKNDYEKIEIIPSSYILKLI